MKNHTLPYSIILLALAAMRSSNSCNGDCPKPDVINLLTNPSAILQKCAIV